MTDATVQAIPARLDVAPGGDVADYFALLKPRVMFLVVFTALVGLVAAPGTGNALVIASKAAGGWRGELLAVDVAAPTDDARG